ncbi:MAG: hypothetical protein AUH46_07045 [Gemmatimonadetes bacterium 13_1_40CM_70_15]|nr:MAG: hypothetical protein AUH46_07045 [Gemmatimonadetes bacterium 13_1_40CM_70_15]
MPRPFLTARWSHLLIVSFEVPEGLVHRVVPPALQLDRWQGRAHVSLVALGMDDVRVRGWRVPGLPAHPQVNFRTYVRHGNRPGVWFIRQLVPNRLIAAVARWRYNEPFDATPIECTAAQTEAEARVEYRIARRWRVAAEIGPTAGRPVAASAAAYFQERYLGYRVDRRGRLTVFRVEHPSWVGREVRRLEWDVDFAALYGAAWGVLNEPRPVSAIYAEGSEVAVYSPNPVTDSTSTSP